MTWDRPTQENWQFAADDAATGTGVALGDVVAALDMHGLSITCDRMGTKRSIVEVRPGRRKPPVGRVRVRTTDGPCEQLLH